MLSKSVHHQMWRTAKYVDWGPPYPQQRFVGGRRGGSHSLEPSRTPTFFLFTEDAGRLGIVKPVRSRFRSQGRMLPP